MREWKNGERGNEGTRKGGNERARVQGSEGARERESEARDRGNDGEKERVIGRESVGAIYQTYP